MHRAPQKSFSITTAELRPANHPGPQHQGPVDLALHNEAAAWMRELESRIVQLEAKEDRNAQNDKELQALIKWQNEFLESFDKFIKRLTKDFEVIEKNAKFDIESRQELLAWRAKIDEEIKNLSLVAYETCSEVFPKSYDFFEEMQGAFARAPKNKKPD